MPRLSRRKFLYGASTPGVLWLSGCGGGGGGSSEVSPPSAGNPGTGSPTTGNPGPGSPVGQAGATKWDDLYSAALGAIPSTALWVATTGNDNNSGTTTAPFKTIARALEFLKPGGQVIIKDGVYSGPNNWINSFVAAIPNGISDSQRTIIRAEKRLGVRILQQARPSGYYQSIVNLGVGSQYVWIDGIIAETSWEAARSDDSANATINDLGTNNRFTRIIVKKSSCSRYGSSFVFGVGAVLEDCHSIGSGRYVFSGGTGGGSAPSGNAVLRRCTSYMPYGPSMEPTASFSFYGSNDGSYGECKNVLFANCYEIDSPHIQSLDGDPNTLKWASFYMPKSVRNVRHIGCGSLRNGAQYGAFSTDNFGGAADLLAEYSDCFAWDLGQGSPSSVAAFRKASNGRTRVTNCTAGKIPGNDLSDLGSTQASNNLFSDTVEYLVRRSNNLGAEQRFAIGAFLSAFAVLGYDQPQPNLRLWPFPYEAELAIVASEIMQRPAGDQPGSVATSGNPYATLSLTKRIWEATGQKMPDLTEIYPQ
jgi:hypothetical protein